MTISNLSPDYWDRFEGKDYDQIAFALGSERMIDETDKELRTRLVSRAIRYSNHTGSFLDIVHLIEQLIHRECPVGLDEVPIRRQVGLGLISRNKTGNWLTRLKTACRAFWSCL